MSFLSTSDQATMTSLLEVDLKDDIYLQNNFYNWLTSEKADGGKNLQVPVRIAGTTQHGADDVAGLAGVVGARPNFGSFVSDWMPTYAFAQVPMVSIELSKGSAHGAVPLLVDAVRDARKAVARDIEIGLCGDGFGTRGVIASNTGSGPYVLTLVNVSDALPVNVGDTLVSSAANNSGSLDAGSATITGVDRDAGTVTVASNSSWAPTNGHFLFNTLDKSATIGFSNPSKLYGLAAYFPTTNRTSTFATVDRSIDPQNLAGCFSVGSATAIRAGINGLIAKIMPKAGAFDGGAMIWTSANTMMALQTELMASVKYTETEIEANVNFEGISFSSPAGKAKAAFSVGIPDNLVYVLTRGSMKYRNALSGADPVAAASVDGKDYVTSFDRVAATCRQWALGQYEVVAPGLNGVLKLQ